MTETNADHAASTDAASTDATAEKYDATIDWDRYWAAADDEERAEASPSRFHAVDALADFVTETGVLEAVADVGCGPGHVVFGLADRFPGTTVVGYDAADPVLAANRERARGAGVGNVRFERTVLPAFDPDRQFGVVFSYFTLCYVADVERALRNLYDAVEPGGALVFNYLNRDAQSYCLEAADAPADHEDHAFVFDPDRYTERFRAVLDGDSVLSPERIHDALGVRPRSVWSVVDRPDKQWAWHHAPLVYVPN